MMRSFRLAVLVSALGYFVDVYDIILFSVVRVASLRDLGVSDAAMTSVGLQLINLQVIGMLVGGILWGIWGDKRGRLSILFGSILLYSTATFLNGFVHTVPQYAVLRFVAGLGLAGELGAGITLVTELLSREKRGYGTMLIVVAGALGGVVGGWVGKVASWQMAYWLGGIGGFILLLLRLQVKESSLFMRIQQKNIAKGSVMLFYRSPHLLWKYIQCLFIGLPFWLYVGLFLALSPEIGKAMGIPTMISAASALMYYCLGLAGGECIGSLVSQRWRSRKKVLQCYFGLSIILILIFLLISPMTESLFYRFCVLFGVSSGFWVLFVTMASEQFGTNIRATVTTSLPNVVRAMVFPCAAALNYGKSMVGLLPMMSGMLLLSLLLAFFTLPFLKETFSVNMDFTE